MIKNKASLEELAKHLGKDVEWVYRNSKSFDCAKVRLNGKVVRPMEFDLDIVAHIYSASGGSLKTEQNQKKPKSVISLKERKKRLWG